MPATNYKPKINYGHPLGQGLIAWWLGEAGCISSRSGWTDLTGRAGTTKRTANAPNPGDGPFYGDHWTKARSGKPVYKSTNSPGTWYMETGFNPFSARMQFTISLWYKKLTTTSGLGFGVADTNYTNAIGIATSGSNTRLYCSTTASAEVYGYYADAQTNWTHLIYSYNGDFATNATRLVCYKNGASQALTFNAGTVPSPSRTFSSSEKVLIGALKGTVGGTNAYLDDIRIWNRALSPTEMKYCYDNSLANFPGLILNPVPSGVKTPAAAGNRRRRAIICGGAK